MRNITMLFLVIGVFSHAILDAEESAQQQSVEKRAERPGEQSAKTIVYVARNSPVSELSKTLQQFLDGSGGRVVTDPISNLLLIDTTVDNHERVLAVLQQLDRAPQTIRVQLHLLRARGEKLSNVDTSSLTGPTVEVLERINELDSMGQVYVANRMELTTIEAQPAMLQVGEDVALIASTTSRPGQGPAKGYRTLAVGTMLKIEARVSGESDIVLTTEFEKSEVKMQRNDAVDESQAPSQGVTQLTHQTTSRIPDGHSILLASLGSQSSDGATEVYLILSASISTAGNTSTVARDRASTKNAVPAADADAPSAPAGDLHLNPRYLAYYAKLIAKYDENGDLFLDKEERSKMAKDPSDADTDGDGLVTVEELTIWSMKR